MDSSYGDYWLTDDPAAVDLDIVCDLLRGMYWAANRSREQIARSVGNSLCFSVRLADRQIAIARVLTDHGAASYVCDVVVDGAHRNRGVGEWLMRSVLEHPAVRDTRVLLVTRDAQPFYGNLGFVTHPFECMVRGAEGDAAEAGTC
jgi:ribosomal protein S18 acetylase RimI-like enzyme